MIYINNKISLLRWIIIFSGLFILMQGCIKEEFSSSELDASLDLESGLAIPIGFSHLSLEDYLSDSLPMKELIIDADGFMRIFYSSTVDSGIFGDLLTVEDVSAGNEIINKTGSSILLTLPGSSLIISDSVEIPVTSTQSDARIDSIRLLEGLADLNVTSQNLSGSITFSIPGLKNGGVPFSVSRNLANPDFSIDLSEYTLIPGHDASGGNNLKILITIYVQNPSGPIDPGSPVISLQTGLTGLNYSTIYGNFTGYSIDLQSESIATPFFRNLSGGSIVFTHPEIRLYFENSAGVPLGIWFRGINAIREGVVYSLTGPGVPTESEHRIIAYPTLIQEGNVVTDIIILNDGNTNLPGLIASNPDSVIIEASSEVEDMGPAFTGFIRSDSHYKLSAEVELPLWGKADIIILADTLDFDYLSSAIPAPEEIERLIVRTSITNSFPVEAVPQIYLLDENRVLIDSLFTGKERIEGAGDRNGDGRADPQKQDPIDIDLPDTRIDNLYDARYIIIKARLLTTAYPSEDVKLYSTYFLDCNIGLIAQLKVRTGK